MLVFAEMYGGGSGMGYFVKLNSELGVFANTWIGFIFMVIVLVIVMQFFEKLKERYEVETVVINDLELNPVQFEEYSRRKDGTVSEEAICLANKIREADRIVIAAPFWDMSIPAALKNFFELCSIFDVTFKSNDKTCYGNCKAEKMLYITTRGMDIDTGDVLEQGSSYLKALSWLWGIGPLEVVSAQNMDYLSDTEIEERIRKAISEGLKIAEEF